MHTGKGAGRDEKVVWDKDGHPVPVSFQTAQLLDARGNVLGAVEIFSDISTIKALEEEMRRTKTMAALGELSATVAHEIRNPLGAMGLWAGILERELELNDPRRKTLDKIVEGLARLNKIVSSLLVYTRPLKAQFQRVNLQNLLEETVNFVAVEIERQEQKIVVEKHWNGAAAALVYADPEKMQQVIMNLCLNAVQAMPDGGTLSVSIEEQKGPRDDLISFRIADTGIGIAKENIDKVFVPFYTTKENGTGLGLAIVKKIVEHHSGYITVDSEKGKGAAFKVFLPMIKD
jgi:signal transduction histidine kinase